MFQSIFSLTTSFSSICFKYPAESRGILFVNIRLSGPLSNPSTDFMINTNIYHYGAVMQVKFGQGGFNNARVIALNSKLGK